MNSSLQDPAWVDYSRDELLISTSVLQSASYELRTPVAVRRICKLNENYTYTLTSFTYAVVSDNSAVRYPT